MPAARRLDHDQVAADYMKRLDLSVGELARLHGCTAATIGRIVRRRGLTNTVRSSAVHDRDAIAVDYAARFLTVAAIARKHGCNQTTVHDIARSRGLRRMDRSVEQ